MCECNVHSEYIVFRLPAPWLTSSYLCLNREVTVVEIAFLTLQIGVEINFLNNVQFLSLSRPRVLRLNAGEFENLTYSGCHSVTNDNMAHVIFHARFAWLSLLNIFFGKDLYSTSNQLYF